MAALPGLLVAPHDGPHPRLVERREPLAGEAVVADVRHRALHAGLVRGAPHAGGIDDEAPRLRVLEEGDHDAGLERIGRGDERARVIRNHDAKHAAVEAPGRLARLDRARRRLPEARIDEAVAGHARREDPRAEAPAPSALIGLERRHPPRVEVDLLARCAVGYRDRRRAAAEAEHRGRKAVQRRRRDQHALPGEQPADFGEPQSGSEALGDEVPVRLTLLPARAVRPLAAAAQRRQDRRHPLVAEGRGVHPGRQPTPLARPQVAPHGLRVEPEPARDLLAPRPGEPLPEHLRDLDHRDLPIRHHPSPPGTVAGREAAMVG